MVGGSGDNRVPREAFHRHVYVAVPRWKVEEETQVSVDKLGRVEQGEEGRGPARP